MKQRTFIDTNVLVYVFSDDARSARALQHLIAGGVVSAQSLNEFSSVARRKLKMSWPELRDALAAVRYLCPTVAVLSVATHRLAIELAEKHGFSIFDSSLLAAALETGCETFLSEDLQDGMVVEGRLRIVDPFRQP